MAVPTVYAVGTASNVTTAALSPGIPAGTIANDILVLFIEAANEPLNTISGYNRIGSGAVVQATGLVTDLSVFWKRAGASEVAPTVTASPQDHLSGRIVGIRGAAANSSPVHVVNTGADNVSSTSATIPGGTTTLADCLIFAAVATGVDTNSTTMTSAWTNASLTSITEQVDNWTLSGNGGGVGVATGGKATAGAYSATTVTLATAATKSMMSFAITATEAVPGITETPIGVDKGRGLRGGGFGY